MQTKIDEAFEQLCLLQDIRQQIVTDLQNKNITLEIDTEQYNITIDSNGVTFKPDPTRSPKGLAYAITPIDCVVAIYYSAIIICFVRQNDRHIRKTENRKQIVCRSRIAAHKEQHILHRSSPADKSKVSA